MNFDYAVLLISTHDHVVTDVYAQEEREQLFLQFVARGEMGRRGLYDQEELETLFAWLSDNMNRKRQVLIQEQIEEEEALFRT